MYRILFAILFAALLLCPAMLSPATLLAQDATFVPPILSGNTVAGNAATSNATMESAIAPASGSLQDRIVIATRDSMLGDRIARISAEMESLPQEHEQIWREFDITPHTRERRLPTGSTPPEQALIDWIVRKTGSNLWHTAPFGILTASPEKLYAYHTREVLLTIADIVDRFVCPQLWTDACTLRIVATSRPDWLSRGHAHLRPIRIATPGVQGWIVERSVAQGLLAELGRRSDFRELVPPQPLIAHGIQHNVVVKRQRQYLRDVQPNPSVLSGFAEDRVTMDEGIGLSLTPLAVLDGHNMDVHIKLDIVQIERMLTTPIDITTATNSRQRFHVESPQVSSFNLDEIVRFPKNMVLLLDLGTVPLPNTTDDNSRNILEEIARGVNPARRGNVLIFIESTSGGISPAVSSFPPAIAPVRAARNFESPYWQGIR